MDMPTILFVDDEPNILKTLTRLFLDQDYDIHTADSGQKALDLIDSGIQPTVIVSDQRMPEMNGAEFLSKAKKKAPDSIRMVLTGYADINAAINAINLGGIYRYIMKPWNDEDLKLTIRDAIDHFNLVLENRKLNNEIVEKNRKLAELNKLLEKKVAERTRELRQTVKELEGRDLIQEYLLKIHPLEELLQTVLKVVVNVTGVKGAAIYMTDDNGEHGLEKKATHDFKDEPAGLQEALLIQTINKTIESGEPGSCRFDEKENKTLFWATPINKGDKKFGALVVKCPSDNPLSSGMLNAITGFAMQTAIGINDSKMHDNLDDIGASLDDVLMELQES